MLTVVGDEERGTRSRVVFCAPDLSAGLFRREVQFGKHCCS